MQRKVMEEGLPQLLTNIKTLRENKQKELDNLGPELKSNEQV